MSGHAAFLSLPAANKNARPAVAERRVSYVARDVGSRLSFKRRLRGEFTFGLNRIYLLFPELGFTTSYYLCVNSLVIEQCAGDIRALTIPKFISWRSRDLIQPTPDLAFLHTTYSGPKFATDVRGRLWEGATVTYVTLQVAFHMGFGQVILIGVDHSYAAQGKPNATVVHRATT